MEPMDGKNPGDKPGTGRGAIRRFAGDERGTIAILWAMMLVAVLGFVALIFDIGRMGVLQSDLQSFADNVALAAAGELDGRADAIDRADAAAADLIRERSIFADNALAEDQVAFEVFYHATLPASDLTPMGTPLDRAAATTPARAAFAEVTVTPRRITLQFASALAGLLGQQGLVQPFVRATAVAGRSMEACDISPLMFCLPNADYGRTPSAVIGNMIRLRSGGNGALWGPGNFGFVDISNADTGGICAGQGNIERCQMAAEITISQCYSQRGVDLETGQRNGLRNHINVRFDRYTSPLSNNEPIYPAAPNVVTGDPRTNPELCTANPNPPPGTRPESLPRDRCFATGTCSPPRVGNGDFDMTTYMAVNHGGGAHLEAYNSVVPPGLSNTRYATYLREIAYSRDAAANPAGGALNPPATLSENGLPRCTPHVSTNPERRVVIAAGIDCAANNIRGAQRNVPVERYFRLFMTEPVGGAGGNDVDIWAEVIGVEALDGYTSAGTGGIFRDVIQLYR
jgi:Flp pilus assembly protein TadG